MALEILWASGSPFAWRVLLGAEILGLSYNSTLLDVSRGDLKTPGFVALNPRGKVPVIRDDGFILYESLAILDYLDSKRSASGSPRQLFGEVLQEGAFIRRVISEFECYLREPLITTATGLLAALGSAPVDPVRATEQEKAAKRALDELKNFESLASDHPWLGGERPSAADAVVFPFIQLVMRCASKSEARAGELGLLSLLTAYPHLERWVRRVEALPGYDRTYPPHWRTS